MSMINLDALNAFEEKFSSHGYESDTVFIRQQDIPENGSIFIRPFPPREDMNGIPFTVTVQHWFKVGTKKVCVISPESFNQKDVTTEKLEVMKGQHPELVPYLKNTQNYNKEVVFQVPCYICENVVFENGQLKSYSIKEGKPAVFEFTTQIQKAFSKLFKDPQFNTSDGAGVTSWPFGRILTVSKAKGTNGMNSYSLNAGAILPIEPLEYPSMVDRIKRKMYSDNYMLSIVSEALAGQPTMQKAEYRFPELRESNTPAVNTAPLAASNAPLVSNVQIQQPTTPIVQATPTVAAPIVQAAPIATPVEVVAPLATPIIQTPPVEVVNTGSPIAAVLNTPAAPELDVVGKPNNLLAQIRANQAKNNVKS